jgi:2,3-bisphosphoglycerate-independent phosphoglycerate mutase
MDRDNRWDRTLIAWKTLILGDANYYSTNIKGLIQDAYNRGETDEFISPTIIKKNEENYFKGINNGDGLIIANFRSDRVRQIINSLTDKNFNNFIRSKTIDYSSLLGMVPYSYEIDKLMPSLFPTNNIKNSLGEILSNSGLKQLRIAETEKYPHVTFFFNGGNEKVFNGEERILISSPKVETYDLTPKMSASEITDEIIKSINNKNFDIIIANFANPDMVGHSGNYESTLQAVEYVDECLGKIFKAINEKNGILILTSDHGNSETMWDEDQKSKHTAHTNNLVPFILINGGDDIKLNKGKLSDIAPTIIELLNIDKPKEIEGNSLII